MTTHDDIMTRHLDTSGSVDGDGTSSPFDPDLERRIVRFLTHEARLMDEHRYREWFALWADDGIYWVPSNLDDYDPATHVSLIYEDVVRLRDRVERLESGAAYAQAPRSRLSRVVGNTTIDTQRGDLVQVHSTFVLVETRHGVHDVFAGSVTHHLRLVGDAVRMVFKKVVLTTNDDFIDNLTFLL